VIVGLLAGEQLGGVAGIFLSVPVLAALKIILVRVRSSDRIIGSRK
jgi:predicted PurR-regulated permease PerM